MCDFDPHQLFTSQPAISCAELNQTLTAVVANQKTAIRIDHLTLTDNLFCCLNVRTRRKRKRRTEAGRH